VLLTCILSSYAQSKNIASEVYRDVKGSVAVILTYDGNGKLTSQGSAVATNSNILITNEHVVSSSKEVIVKHQGEEYRGIVVLSNKELDLAQIYVPALKIKPASLKIELPSIGEKVFSVGAPRGFELSISEGIISGQRILENVNLIQTTAAISPGSSGGGLFDSSGSLVGITTWHYKDSQSLNFAVSVNEISTLIDLGNSSNPQPDKSSSQKVFSTRAPLIRNNLYVFQTFDDAVTFFNPDDYRKYQSYVSYIEQTYSFEGKYKNELSRGSIEADCNRRIYRRTTNISVSDWRTGRHIITWEPRKGWNTAKKNSGMEVQIELACDSFASQGKEALINKLSEYHDYSSENLKTRGISINN
jgi:hypothetical protein